MEHFEGSITERTFFI